MNWQGFTDLLKVTSPQGVSSRDCSEPGSSQQKNHQAKPAQLRTLDSPLLFEQWGI